MVEKRKTVSLPDTESGEGEGGMGEGSYNKGEKTARQTYIQAKAIGLGGAASLRWILQRLHH